MFSLAYICAGGPGLICIPGDQEPFYRMLERMGVLVIAPGGPVITHRTIETVNAWLENTTLLRVRAGKVDLEEIKMFEVLDRGYMPPPAVGAAEIVMSGRHGVRDSYVITLAFGIAVATRLGWEEGTKVSIAWGTEKDLGKVKILLWRSGSEWQVKRGNKAGTVLKIYTGAVPETFSGELPRQPVRYEVIAAPSTGGGSFVVIDLPKNFHERKAA
jgi:hypothetical protein